MSHFAPVALPHANRLINHGPTVLITSVFGGRRNVMAAAWSMPVEFSPPRVAVVIDKSTFTRELAQASGGFGLCLPGLALADLTYSVGQHSGREGDKFARYGIGTVTGPVLGLPRKDIQAVTEEIVLKLGRSIARARRSGRPS